MIYKITPILLFLFSTFSSNEIKPTEPKLTAATTKVSFASKAESLYNNLNSNNLSLPKLESFTKALEGFYDLKEKGKIKRDILTLVDFSLSSNTKRMWIIDLSTNTVLYNSLVAHGRNTGDEFAKSFSNQPESYKSSLGFYATGEVYQGKHGLSLKLDGLEKGVNDKARERAVVIHGADYVAESFIKQNKRLGRSLGCPAIPVGMTKEIINTIKDKSCLFIYHPSSNKKGSIGQIS
ncbi:hypothetical protein J2X31_000453 [Flavobacterium arsenatis]|uniref:Murein L,D-transpeptidase catalytic domain family protein n=1 Tax=Flavobacterium arsenatis TaxID=1484332 RepID=A0ABU1TKF4_9FLAO|nr:murein L,D-transpeptidase catalytic domain family protein [Flavobacterium arsenatis]MDR6966460.1 hypothetical protein [Flavobacterium arsenatis]